MRFTTKYFRDLPLTRKLLLFCLSTCLTSLVVAMMIVTIYDRYSIEDIIKNELKVIASIVASQSTVSIIFDDQTLASNGLEALSQIDNIEYACVFTFDPNAPEGQQTRRLASYPSKNVPCSSYTPNKIEFIESNDDNHIELVKPISLDNEIIGYLYINSNTSTIRNLQRNHLFVLIGVVIVASLIALWLANLFSQWISGPLHALKQTAERISQHDDYSIRAQKYNNDEVGQVVDSFNKMLSMIQQEDSHLRESEEKFRMISSLSKVGIFQTDLNGLCIYANQELAAICGMEINEILEQNWSTAIHPDDKAIILEKFRNMIKRKHAIKLHCRLLLDKETRWIDGYVDLLKRDNEHIGFLGTINDVTSVKKAQLQLEHMAFYDTLTGLANRRLFRNRLEHVINNLKRDGSSLGLILLDLDHFKNVNDSLGHDAGDSLLTIIAEHLQRCVRASDTVARLGGDEFAIILPGINSSLAISSIAEKILIGIKEPVILQETEIRISASAGISMAPDDTDNAEILIKNADLALYRAKDKGRDEYQFYTREMNTALIDHLNLVKDLRHAIDSQDFGLLFQPQVDIQTRKLIGFEALIRWQHYQRGIISPLDFIPAAEETGLIIPLGRWVISAACQQLKQLNKLGLIKDDVVMTVNLSAKQFQDEGLVNHITSTLNDNDLKSSQFEIELTETALMENLDEALVKLNAIKKIGISISIDDFGTGYSSLGYLKKLPVNVVKVDRSFVNDIPNDKNDMEITAAVIAMAHNLRYEVVAEGVETQEQLDFLKNCGCDYAQGYFFSRPLPAPELEKFCKEYSVDNRFKASSL